MAEKDTAAPAAAAQAVEKPKITLRFHKHHTHHTGELDANGNEIVKQYRPGDRDKFTQSEADIIRDLRVAQKIINP